MIHLPAPVDVFADDDRCGDFAGSAHGQFWTAYEDDFVLSSKNHGKGYKAIGREIGRTRDAVRSRYRELIGDGRETRRESRCIGQQRAWGSGRKRAA